MEGVVATLKVLLTGHDGYIGSVLGPKLIAAGHHFVCLDTFYFGDGHIDDGHDQTSTLRKDIRDIAEDDVRGVDVVIHLAALSKRSAG